MAVILFLALTRGSRHDLVSSRCDGSRAAPDYAAILTRAHQAVEAFLVQTQS